MNYDDFQHILFERREHGVLWMTLNRPEVLNAADRQLHTELVEVWRTIDRDLICANRTVHAALPCAAAVRSVSAVRISSTASLPSRRDFT